MYHPYADFHDWQEEKCELCWNKGKCTMFEWDIQCSDCLHYNLSDDCDCKVCKRKTKEFSNLSLAL